MPALPGTFSGMNRGACVLSLVVQLCLAACAPMPPPVPFSGQYSGESEVKYRRGYHLGVQDGKTALGEDYERHHSEYSGETETAFSRGYALGYETGEEHAGADDASRDRAKNDGYNAGRADAENGLSPFYRRHRSAYTESTESDFRKAYIKGYNAARRGDDDLAPKD